MYKGFSSDLVLPCPSLCTPTQESQNHTRYVTCAEKGNPNPVLVAGRDIHTQHTPPSVTEVLRSTKAVPNKNSRLRVVRKYVDESYVVQRRSLDDV